jgi:signal transduction histidine kinase
MSHLRRLLPKTIVAQITTLVAAAVLVGVLLTFSVLVLIIGNPKARMNPEIKAASEASRIATIVREVKAAKSDAELVDRIARFQTPGGNVELQSETTLSPRSSFHLADNAFAQQVSNLLKLDWHIDPVEDKVAAGWDNAIIVHLNGDSVLVFQNSEYQVAQTFLLVQAGVALSIILVAMLVVSVYAIRWVTRPLSEFVAAARSFGRPSAEERTLKVDGPREIAQVAQALNDMRKRVRTLVDERTRMLAAISHDLRTPLTRLRLRLERVAQVAERRSMLNDISTIDAMISETLAYLRDGGASEATALVDLPSLLQTICWEFNDVGHEVRYSGPSRFAFACQSRSLSRAITNIIENGVKHGSLVTVVLGQPQSADAHIEISDNGPGIPAELVERVFEPFFKADPARSPLAGRGFGLGLSIARDIIERHGGSINLLNGSPQGLIVRMMLKGPERVAVKRVAETEKTRGPGTEPSLHLSLR